MQRAEDEHVGDGEGAADKVDAVTLVGVRARARVRVRVRARARVRVRVTLTR